MRDLEPALTTTTNPTRRIIARTTFTMAAVYENLSSDLVWQIARTFPTTENHTPRRNLRLEILVKRWDGGRELLCHTVVQSGTRRAIGEILQRHMRIEALKDL